MSIEDLLSLILLLAILLVILFHRVLIFKLILHRLHFDVFLHILGFEFINQVKSFMIPKDGMQLYSYLFFDQPKRSEADDTLTDDFYDDELSSGFVFDTDDYPDKVNSRYKFVYEGIDYRLTYKQIESLCLLSGVDWVYRSEGNILNSQKIDEINCGLKSRERGMPVLVKVGKTFGHELFHPIPIDLVISQILSGGFLSKSSVKANHKGVVIRCFLYKERFINLLISILTSIAAYAYTPSAAILSLINLFIIIFHYNIGRLYYSYRHLIFWRPKLFLSKYANGYRVMDFLSNFSSNWKYCDKIKRKVYNNTSRYVFDYSGPRANYKDVFMSNDHEKMKEHFPKSYERVMRKKKDVKIGKKSENNKVKSVEIEGDPMLKVFNHAINSKDDSKKIYRAAGSKKGVIHIKDSAGIKVKNHRHIFLLSDDCYVEGLNFDEAFRAINIKNVPCKFRGKSAIRLIRHYVDFNKDRVNDLGFFESFLNFYKTGSVRIVSENVPNAAWKRFCSNCAQILKLNNENMVVKYDKRGTFNYIDEPISPELLNQVSLKVKQTKKWTTKGEPNKNSGMISKLYQRRSSVLNNAEAMGSTGDAYSVFNKLSDVIKGSRLTKAEVESEIQKGPVKVDLKVVVTDNTQCDTYLAVAKKRLGDVHEEAVAKNESKKAEDIDKIIKSIESIQGQWKPASRKTHTNVFLKARVKEHVRIRPKEESVSCNMSIVDKPRYSKNQTIIENYYSCLEGMSENVTDTFITSVITEVEEAESKNSFGMGFNQRILAKYGRKNVREIVKGAVKSEVKMELMDVLKMDVSQPEKTELVKKKLFGEGTNRIRRRLFYSSLNNMIFTRMLNAVKELRELSKLPLAWRSAFEDRERLVNRFEDSIKAIFMISKKDKKVSSAQSSESIINSS